MNKIALTEAVADKSGLTKTGTTQVLDTLLETLEVTLAQSESVQLVGVGTLRGH